MPSESNQVVKAVKKVLPAVVSIGVSKRMQVFKPMPNLFGGLNFMPINKKKKMKMGGGSGFIISTDGTILTNRHVVEDPKAEYVVVLQSGEKLKPKILAKDPLHDIAILKINPKKGKKKIKLATAQFSDSSKLDLGQTVVAVGNALGLFKNTVSTGVVSGLSREIKAQSDFSQQKTKLRGLIQTDAAINPGNSGGPLIDITGKVIGVNAAMVFGAENIGFAMPINNAKKALAELRKYGRIRQPYLGVRYLPINEAIKAELKLPLGRGALVIAEPGTPHSIRQAVIPGSPAYKAGIKEADIILEMKNKKITCENSIADILAECKIGQAIPIELLRKGRKKHLKIILGERK